MEHETFWTLLCSPAHIELELFLMFVVDGLLGALLYPLLIKPRIQRWKKHHKNDDTMLEKLQKRVDELERIVKGQ